MSGLPLVLACALLGGALYRWRGGPAWLPAPALLKRVLCAAALTAGAFSALPLELRWYDVAFATWGFLAALRGISLGHGAYMDLGHTTPEKEHDRVGAWQEEPEFAWLRGLVPAGVLWGSRAAYEGLALAVTGIAATAGPGLALVLLGDWSGWWLLLAGALKAPAYWIGWRLARGSRATVIGEWLTGAVWGAVVSALL